MVKKITKSRKVNIIQLANQLKRELQPFSQRIKIVGSIRRKDPDPHDIDFVLTPKDINQLKIYLKNKQSKGQIKITRFGNKIISFQIKGVSVDLFISDKKNFGAMMLNYSGPAGWLIGMKKAAKEQNLKLSQKGLLKNDKIIASKSEKEIFEALGKEWNRPEYRGKRRKQKS